MLLNMRDKETGELVSKDILDLDMDMSVSEEQGLYYVNVNQKYRTDKTFGSKGEAEDSLRAISIARNELESELRAYE